MSKLGEQGTIADIPLRSTNRLYYVRVENNQPVDEGWVSVDEAKSMNATDRRMFGSPQNRYFQDADSASAFSASLGQAPMDQMPPVPPTDDFGAGMEEPGLGGEPTGPEFETGQDMTLGGEDEFDFGAGLDDMGDELGGDMPSDEAGLDDGLGDLGDEEDLDLEDEEPMEIVVPRRIKLVPESMQERIPTFQGKPRMSQDPDPIKSPEEMRRMLKDLEPENVLGDDWEEEGGVGVADEPEDAADDVVTQTKNQWLMDVEELVQEETGLDLEKIYYQFNDEDASYFKSILDDAWDREDKPYKALSILHDFYPYKQLMRDDEPEDEEPYSEAPPGEINPAQYQMSVSNALFSKPEGPEITKHMMEDPAFFEKMSEIVMTGMMRGENPESVAEKIIRLFQQGDEGPQDWGPDLPWAESMQRKEGLAAEKGVTEDDVDPKQLAMGIKVEKEHTDDEDEAKTIALDHLAEIPDYYTRLKAMEKDADVGESFEGLVAEQMDFAGQPFDPSKTQAFPSPVSRRQRRFTKKIHQRPKVRPNRLADPRAGTGPRSVQPPSDPMARAGIFGKYEAKKEAEYKRTYFNQFPSDYHDIPPEILDHPELEDMSWGNDVSPSFGMYDEDTDTDIRIFVQHPDPEQREVGGARFAVSVMRGGENVFDQDTDDVNEAIAMWEQAVQKFRGQRGAVESIGDKRERTVPLDTRGFGSPTCPECGEEVEDAIVSNGAYLSPCCRADMGDLSTIDMDRGLGTRGRREAMEPETTEEGMIEAYLDGLISTEELIEQTMGTAGQVAYSPRDQAILGRQVGALTQQKAPQIQWGQQAQQGPQIPQDLQPLYQQYEQAKRSGNTAQAQQLRNQLAFELQLQGIDPNQVLR